MVGASVGLDRPVGPGNPVVGQHVEVPWLGTDPVGRVHLCPGHGVRALDAEGVIVVPLHVPDTVGVVLVVPRRDDFLRTHELNRVDEIVGGDGYAIGPAGPGVQPVVDAPPVVAERPISRQRGDRPARLRVECHHAEVVGAKETGKLVIDSLSVPPRLASGEA